MYDRAALLSFEIDMRPAYVHATLSGAFTLESARTVYRAIPQAAPPIMDAGYFTEAVANNRGVRMRASESVQELLSRLGV